MACKRWGHRTAHSPCRVATSGVVRSRPHQRSSVGGMGLTGTSSLANRTLSRQPPWTWTSTPGTPTSMAGWTSGTRTTTTMGISMSRMTSHSMPARTSTPMGTPDPTSSSAGACPPSWRTWTTTETPGRTWTRSYVAPTPSMYGAHPVTPMGTASATHWTSTMTAMAGQTRTSGPARRGTTPGTSSHTPPPPTATRMNTGRRWDTTTAPSRWLGTRTPCRSTPMTSQHSRTVPLTRAVPTPPGIATTSQARYSTATRCSSRGTTPSTGSTSTRAAPSLP